MKLVWTGLGWLFVGLGLIGVVLPIMPTTPFLLLAAACFMRGSDRLYAWLMHHPVFGAYLRAYREGRGIPLRAKVLASVMITLSLGSTAIFVIPLLVGQVAAGLLGAGVIAYIWSHPTWDGTFADPEASGRPPQGGRPPGSLGGG